MSGPRVFVVDDAADLRLLFRLSLERHGYQVVGEAPSVALALAEAPGSAPEVVLIDVVLPDGSGVDVVRGLREVLPDALLVVCTGVDDSALLAACREAGADGHLNKIESADMAVALGALLAGDRR